jgi:hypothetical protein
LIPKLRFIPVVVHCASSKAQNLHTLSSEAREDASETEMVLSLVFVASTALNEQDPAGFHVPGTSGRPVWYMTERGLLVVALSYGAEN